MAKHCPIVLRNQFHERLFDFLGSNLLRQTEPLRKSRHMRIDNNADVYFESVAQNYIRGFAPNAIQLRQLFHGAGHLSAMTLDEFLAASLDIPGFIAEESESLDASLKVKQVGICEIRSAAKFFEQVHRHDVDLFVGALRRQDRGDEQFERVGIIQFTVRIGIGRGQGRNYVPDSRCLGLERFSRHYE